jgi:16S rRNA (cytosine967-C5)-methyltransferase
LARSTLPADSLAFALDAAAHAIGAVVGGRNLDSALAALQLPPTIRPAVMDLAFVTLRRYGRGDLFLGKLMERPLSEDVIRGLLLAAISRLETRPLDAHTTVDQAVTAAATLAHGKYKGLVNGVLRNFLRRREELSATAETDDVAHWQHPNWWLDKLRSAYPDDWQAIAAAGNLHPPMSLRINRWRVATPDFSALLAQAGIAHRITGETSLQLDKPLPVERLPGFAEGLVSVQDFGAQQAAPLIDACTGMRVLDACAAPGGKTAHLLERARLDLVALDADAKRAARVVDNLHRLELDASVKVADCRDLTAWWDGRPFDRILADVPCSASGVVRRHPDIKWLRRPGDVAGFARTQSEILDALWQTLAPGGTMLYATCSLFPEENADQVATFVARHPDAQRLPTHGEELEWQLMPDAEQDGFYYARLEKR